MREIEVKFQIKDFEETLNTFRGNGVDLGTPIIQIDNIIVRKPNTLHQTKSGEPILRIREEVGKFKFTFKKDITDQLDCLEYETKIEDGTQLLMILDELGYHSAVKVNKTRYKFKFDSYTICVDSVEDLGSFIEIEKITNDEVDVNGIRVEMINLLGELGIPYEKQVFQGYDRLLDQKINKWNQ